MVEITIQEIRRLVKSRDMYETPDLNDSLLLHGLRASSLGDLSAYSNVSAAFLEGNCLKTLEGIRQFPVLKYANITNNLIEACDLDNILSALPALEELHLGGNKITCCTVSIGHNLRVLRLNKNKLQEVPNVGSLKSLEIFDISGNCIANIGDDLITTLRLNVPTGLLQLYLNNNEFISREKRYRQKCIVALPELRFLDNSAVDACEREVAVAAITEGPEAAIDVRKRHAVAAKDAREKLLRDFREFQIKQDPELCQLIREIHSIVS